MSEMDHSIKLKVACNFTFIWLTAHLSNCGCIWLIFTNTIWRQIDTGNIIIEWNNKLITMFLIFLLHYLHFIIIIQNNWWWMTIRYFNHDTFIFLVLSIQLTIFYLHLPNSFLILLFAICKSWSIFLIEKVQFYIKDNLKVVQVYQK